MADRYQQYADQNPPDASDDEGYAPSPTASPGRTAAVPVGATSGGNSGSSERIDREVQRAQEQLLTLKRQQEQIEKQKRELEELSRRQEELERGKGEMSEKLTRALAILDRQTGDAQKRVEQLRATTESFSNHLRTLEDIQPKSWAQNDMQKELNRALSYVDHARGEFNQSRARLQSESATAGASSGNADTAAAEHAASQEYDELFQPGADRPFLHWLKAGLAFTLPLTIVVLLAIIVYCWLTLSGHP